MSNWHGRWQNQHGAELELCASADGQVRGSMHLHDPDLRLEPFPLCGYLRDDVLGFAVDFGPLGNVTVWSGRMRRGQDGQLELESLSYLIAGPGGGELHGPVRWSRIEALAASSAA